MSYELPALCAKPFSAKFVLSSPLLPNLKTGFYCDRLFSDRRWATRSGRLIFQPAQSQRTDRNKGPPDIASCLYFQSTWNHHRNLTWISGAKHCPLLCRMIQILCKATKTLTIRNAQISKLPIPLPHLLLLRPTIYPHSLLDLLSVLMCLELFKRGSHQVILSLCIITVFLFSRQLIRFA